MSYITLKIYCAEEMTDILIAELSELGFDAFLEFEGGFEGSMEKPLFQEDAVKELLTQYGVSEYEFLDVEKQNWNAIWESNYPVVEVSDNCVIRAPFHTLSKTYQYELLIVPKMSFGTGHHSTTLLMMQNLLQIPHKGLDVLDVGCGTGILGILSKKLGAAKVFACDIEEWAVENSKENAQLNQVELEISWGTLHFFYPALPSFDIILANINRNVLLEDIPAYEKRLRKNGHLLVSGFYKKDVEAICQKAKEAGLLILRTQTNSESDESWACVVFQKS
ncbi:MAG: 50S ribosomal protein L11 methyltransferase [Flammeovirgaceae bacterium]